MKKGRRNKIRNFSQETQWLNFLWFGLGILNTDLPRRAEHLKPQAQKFENFHWIKEYTDSYVFFFFLIALASD